MPKCRKCKSGIKKDIDDFVRIGQVLYYHTDCYIEKELENDIPIEIINETVKKEQERYTKEVEKKVKKYKEKNIQNYLDELVEWIKEAYDIDYLPKTFYIKMASIANGTYKGIKEPIGYEDIFDMLQRRKKQFDMKFIKKRFDNKLGRFYYDLAVVLSQYGGYKNWKAAQAAKTADAMEDTKLQQRLSKSYEDKGKRTQSTKSNGIEDILDDIFE